MRTTWKSLFVIAALLAGVHAAAHATVLPAPATTQAASIDWREGDVDDAFTEARETGKPVMLYWGARWCPPCNQLKQTLFKDPVFIAQTRNFIAVHLDGDDKNAQSWGDVFGIAGYPTVIILRPDRSEITRLSGDAAATSLAQVLRLTATRTSSTEDLLQRAGTPQNLSKDDWLLLENFDWTDDPKHFADPAKASALLKILAAAAPTPALRRQFALTSLALDTNYGAVKLSAVQQVSVPQLLTPLLENPAEVTQNRDILSLAGAPLILGVTDVKQRRRLTTALIAALDQIALNNQLPLDDRLSTVGADIAFSKAANNGKVTQAVLAKVRARVAMVDKLATNPMLRQSVMPDAGDYLDQAGDHEAAQKLLEAELPHAIAPYYFMADLAEMAEAQHDPTAALTWARAAAATAQGPATKVQWAIMYSDFVLRLQPQDGAAVAQSAQAVIAAFDQQSSSYAGRTKKKFIAWQNRLHAWSKVNQGGAVLQNLNATLAKACGTQITQACAVKFI